MQQLIGAGADTNSHISYISGLWEIGKRDYRNLRGQKHHRNTTHRIYYSEFIGAHRDWSWSNNQGASMSLSKELHVYIMVVGVTIGMGIVSDTFACSWNYFPHTGLTCPVLIWGYVPSFIVSCYALFCWYPWKACSFLKENRGEWILGRGEVWKLGRVEGGEAQARM